MFTGVVRGVLCMAMAVYTCDGSWWGTPFPQHGYNQSGWAPGPMVHFAAPQNGAEVSGTIVLRAEVNGAWPVTVTFSADGTDIGTARQPPYEMFWTVPATPASFVLTAQVVDGWGHAATASIDVSQSSSAPAAEPTISFEEPAAGADVSGEVEVYAMTGAGLTTVEYSVDGQALATVSAGSTVTWDSLALANGPHVLEASATGAGGAQAVAEVQVTVANAAPFVAITSPESGSDVTGTVLLAATATDAQPLTEVQFYVDTQLIGTATAAPWQVEWNSAPWDDGGYRIIAVATSAAGQMGTTEIPVDVDH